MKYFKKVFENVDEMVRYANKHNKTLISFTSSSTDHIYAVFEEDNCTYSYMREYIHEQYPCINNETYTTSYNFN